MGNHTPATVHQPYFQFHYFVEGGKNERAALVARLRERDYEGLEDARRVGKPWRMTTRPTLRELFSRSRNDFFACEMVRAPGGYSHAPIERSMVQFVRYWPFLAAPCPKHSRAYCAPVRGAKIGQGIMIPQDFIDRRLIQVYLFFKAAGRLETHPGPGACASS